MKKIKIKEMFFLILFFILFIYILFIKSELYESNSNVIIKNLNNKAATIEGFSFLLPSNSTAQDAFIIQTYLRSFDELTKLDKKFYLKKHYSSEEVDIVQRLKPWNTKEDFLQLYNKRIQIIYDQTTGITTIGFLHTNPETAYEIVKQLINDANEQINKYNKLVAEKQLKFIKKQVKINKKALDESIKKLQKFQNKYLLLDPTQTAQTQFSIVANLEAQLIAKKAKLSELSQYMNEKSFEIIRLKNEIKEAEKTLKKMKKSLAGKDKKSLNVFIFEFERLKGMVELNKELYKQSLLQLEQIKTEINKNSKMLLEITEPFIPQGYKYPEKFKDTITLILIMLLFYGIVSLIQAIIREHID